MTLSFNRFLLLAAVTLMLAGCETWHSWMGDTSAVKTGTNAGCVAVKVPDDLASRSVSTGDGPMDLKANVRLKVGDTSCKSVDGKIRQTVSVALSASKGPALKKNEDLAVPFVAAVMAADGTVSGKKQYQTTFAFEDDNVQATEEVALIFTLSEGQAAAATIYVGFSKDTK